ncbi:MAG: hypothetical protein FJ267_10165, partial [Planctomycetes bacterium]|nr:hypothetical protein [Planctomycetota bacterium]
MSALMLFMPGGKDPVTVAKKSRGLIRDVTADKNEFTVQDLNSGALEPFKVPRRQKIFLLNDKKNILLREILPGDHVEFEIDSKQRDLVVSMTVDRPVVTQGKLVELNLPESRIVLAMEEGNTHDNLAVRVPTSAKLEINGQSSKLTELQQGDRLEITHLSEPGEGKGRVLNTLAARRTMTSVGTVASYDASTRRLSVQVGQGTSSSSLILPLSEKCSVSLNGSDRIDGQPVTAESLRAGDRVSLSHDVQISSIVATRNLQLEGAVHSISADGKSIVVTLENGDRRQLTVDEQCETTLALEKVSSSELRQFDQVKITYSERDNGQLAATTMDARRPTQSDRWTVVIGTQGYLDVTLSPLKNPLNDARLVQGALLSRYAVLPQRATLLIDATKSEWQTRLLETIDNARPQTQLLIYIVGHAYADANGVAYLAPKDFDSSKMAETGLPVEWLSEKLNACSSKDQIVILDVTPAVTGKDGQKQIAGKRLLDKLKVSFKSANVITACNETQHAHVWSEKQHGLFAWWLTSALQGGADTDRDVRLTVDELIGFLSEQSKTANQ